MNNQAQHGPPSNAEERNPAVHARDGPEQVVELSLTEILGRKVKVYNGRGKGTLEIEFYSAEDLKTIANKLGE